MRMLIACLLALAPVPALAQGYVDPRIRVVDFNPDGIIRHVGHTGYQVAIELSSDEKIQTVAVGDSVGWQVTPNGLGTVLFVKPMALVLPTNMTIITNRRRYNFELVTASGKRAGGAIFAMRFRYPFEEVVVLEAASPPPLSVTPPEQWNRAFSFDGSKENMPQEVFDDGVSTFLRFAKETPAPAIFAIQPDGQESLVNFAVRGDYVVIDRVARQFVLRQGGVVTNLYNDAMKAAEISPEAPKERAEIPKKKRGLFGSGKRKQS